MRPLIVGSSAISARLTDVAAPVRAELNTVSDCAVTVTVSCTEIASHADRQVGGDAEVDLHVRLRERLERRRARSGEGDGHGVRAADAHAGNREASVGARRRLVGAARRLVNRDHARARDGLLLRVGHDAGDRAGRHALCRRRCLPTMRHDDQQIDGGPPVTLLQIGAGQPTCRVSHHSSSTSFKSSSSRTSARCRRRRS